MLVIFLLGKCRMSWITFMRLLWNLRKIRLDSFPLSECQGKTVKAGDEFAVQIKRAAVKTKQPVLTIFRKLQGGLQLFPQNQKQKVFQKNYRGRKKEKNFIKS